MKSVYGFGFGFGAGGGIEGLGQGFGGRILWPLSIRSPGRFGLVGFSGIA